MIFKGNKRNFLWPHLGNARLDSHSSITVQVALHYIYKNCFGQIYQRHQSISAPTTEVQ